MARPPLPLGTHGNIWVVKRGEGYLDWLATTAGLGAEAAPHGRGARTDCRWT
ncbi:MAG: hypothetical protein WKF73_18520 [Nocardioidaceae bacterium]|jgi:hypothetical protein